MLIKSLNQCIEWLDMIHSTLPQMHTCSFLNVLALRNRLQFKVEYLRWWHKLINVTTQCPLLRNVSRVRNKSLEGGELSEDNVWPVPGYFATLLVICSVQYQLHGPEEDHLCGESWCFPHTRQSVPIRHQSVALVVCWLVVGCLQLSVWLELGCSVYMALGGQNERPLSYVNCWHLIPGKLHQKGV